MAESLDASSTRGRRNLERIFGSIHETVLSISERERERHTHTHTHTHTHKKEIILRISKILKESLASRQIPWVSRSKMNEF